MLRKFAVSNGGHNERGIVLKTAAQPTVSRHFYMLKVYTCEVRSHMALCPSCIVWEDGVCLGISDSDFHMSVSGDMLGKCYLRVTVGHMS